MDGAATQVLKPIYLKELVKKNQPQMYKVGDVLSIPCWNIIASVLGVHWSWLDKNWLYCIKHNDEEIWVGQGSGVRRLPNTTPIYFIGTLDN